MNDAGNDRSASGFAGMMGGMTGKFVLPVIFVAFRI